MKVDGATRPPKISLCMIVRDEEAHLSRCLTSALPFVDEIIVVDTGSGDRTPDIAREYGAHVIFCPWQDDFSQARNESLRYATGEWILVLDADEELPPETGEGLGSLLEGEKEGWTLVIASPVTAKEGGPVNRSPNLRLFRNRANYRFTGRIHEQIMPAILAHGGQGAIGHSELEIRHYGYIRDGGARREKTLRNIRLLTRAVEENPHDGFLHFNLGVSHFVNGDLAAAARHYEKALANVPREAGYLPLLYRNFALCLYDLGEFQHALGLLRQALAYFPDYPDLLFLQGQIYYEAGLPEARDAFRQCQGIRKIPPRYTVTEGVNSWMAADYLKLLEHPADPEKEWEERMEKLHEGVLKQDGPLIVQHTLEAAKQLLAMALGHAPGHPGLRREMLQLAGAARKMERQWRIGSHG